MTSSHKGLCIVMGCWFLAISAWGLFDYLEKKSNNDTISELVKAGVKLEDAKAAIEKKSK